MSAGRSDLTDEEWEMLGRIDRGAPESRLVPGTILDRLLELRLATMRGGQPRVSDRGKALILREKDRVPPARPKEAP